MFTASIGLMMVVFLTYFMVRASLVYHDLSSNFGRILGGSAIAGCGSGIVLGFILWGVLPTYHYITAHNSEGYYTRYIIGGEFLEEYGRKYLVNLTEEDCYLAAMTYGDSQLKEDEAPILAIESGYMLETEEDVDGWFRIFPEQVSTKSRGSIKWHVLTEAMLISEYKKIGVDLTEE